ncbi:hypothetical protein, conserved [Eimeria praecox]|uniref:Uncharacterized protein n=1 Tax=Eimeria praecox TaxID=51316 RepID=U6GW48_9EIME|nr:hypothetical protein, conserved [Eimeria praecox]
MFFQRDGTGPRNASHLPQARFSLRAGEGPSIVRLFAHALDRHPFNQQIFLVASDGLTGSSTAGARSALNSAISSVANGSCCLCLRNVYLDAFLHLPLQQLLLKRWKGSVVTWRGPGGTAPCCGTAATDAGEAPCPVIGDTGGDRNTASLQNDGVMILKLDRFTAQVLGLDTWIRLPHFMRKSLPPGTRYLKINVQHPAVVRHQKVITENRLKRQMEGVQLEQANPMGYPPSRLYQQLQRSLSSLEPVDLLSSTAPPERDRGSIEARRELAEEVELLLRASGSPNAACNVVQLQCRLSEYRGGVVDMTEATAMATSRASSLHTQHGDDIMLAPELPSSQTPHPLVLPDWDKLFAAVAGAAPKRCPPSTGEAVAAVVVRQKGQRKAFINRASRMSSQPVAQKSDSNGSSRRSSCSEAGDSVGVRQSPPIRPDYLEALHLLHERQRQWRASKSQQRNKDTQPAPENAGHTEEALRMAAPPPFRELPLAEALFSRVTEYLGCLGMDMPVSKEDCEWLREADRRKDPDSIPIASVSGGLLHSTAVVSAAESLCTWLLSQRRGAWAAISVVGVAETAAVYTGQPHGSDISGESTLHLILSSDGSANVRGLLLQTIAACDATTSMP